MLISVELIIIKSATKLHGNFYTLFLVQMVWSGQLPVTQIRILILLEGCDDQSPSYNR